MNPGLIVTVLVDLILRIHDDRHVTLLAYVHVVQHAGSLPLVLHDRLDGHPLVQGAVGEKGRVSQYFQDVVFL